MIDKFGKFSAYLVLSFLVNALSYGLKSSFLPNFIDANLITILLALLAINATTIGIILTKLKEIMERAKKANPERAISIENTTREIRWSITEQVCLVAASLIFLILKKSEVVKPLVPHRDFAVDVILVTLFFYAIDILHDTASAVFIIADSEAATLGAQQIEAGTSTSTQKTVTEESASTSSQKTLNEAVDKS